MNLNRPSVTSANSSSARFTSSDFFPQTFLWILRVTNLLMKGHQSIRLYLWIRLKTLVSTVNSEFNYRHLFLLSTAALLKPNVSVCLLTSVLLRYYALEVTYFKSSLDRKLLELLWNKYWVNTLSSSSLLTVKKSTCGIKSFLIVWHVD